MWWAPHLRIPGVSVSWLQDESGHGVSEIIVEPSYWVVSEIIA
jgi:hypothetical protein